MDSKNTRPVPFAIEGIDLSKLWVVVRNNWPWIALIFVVINLAAFIKIRYTKNLYESESVIKLDVKRDATELGIKGVVDNKTNLMSGEIEVIQSSLFLNRVLDSVDLSVNFYSTGHVLNNDLYGVPPAFIHFKVKDNSVYDIPIYYEPIDDTFFNLRIGAEGPYKKYQFGKTVALPAVDLIVEKNPYFGEGSEIGYFFTLNSRWYLLDYLSSNLTVQPLNFNANTISLAFRDHTAAKARYVLNRIDSVYLSYSNEQKNLANKQKIDWLTNELHQIERKMEDYENYFEDFTLKNKTNDLDDDLKKTISRINKIDSQRFELSQRISDLNDLSDGLNANNINFTLGQRHSVPASLAKIFDDIELLNVEQEKLKMSYNEITFAYREKQKKIDVMRRKISTQLQELQAESLKKLNELNQRKARLEHEFASMPDKNTTFTKNQRFYKLYEGFYFNLMESKAEFEIAQAGSTPDFKILSPATMPDRPISPKRLLILGVGFVASLFVNFFFIGILYLLNNKVTSAQELEKFGDTPVLGIVPSSRYTNDTMLHVIEHPKSMVSEAIRTLRTNLDFFSTESPKKTIAISSTVSGEGKSFIAMNLAGIMALSNKRVILLDLDMRKPKTDIPLTLDDRSRGVSTILIKKNTWQECLVKTPLENFDYVPSGPHPPNPSELLMNGEFAALLEDLKLNYDFIILDTPPVGLVTDGIMAMRRADICIYIFRANYSKKEFLLNLRRIISINKFTNITTLLNALPSTGGKGYGYGYYEAETNKSGRIQSLFKR